MLGVVAPSRNIQCRFLEYFFRGLVSCVHPWHMNVKKWGATFFVAYICRPLWDLEEWCEFRFLAVCMYVCVCVCVYIYIFVCVFVCMYLDVDCMFSHPFPRSAAFPLIVDHGILFFERDNGLLYGDAGPCGEGLCRLLLHDVPGWPQC